MTAEAPLNRRALARAAAEARKPEPVADLDLVVLGASGDLAARLLFPALATLIRRRRVDRLRIWGYALEDWTTPEFLDRLRARMPADVCTDGWEGLASRVKYMSGDLSPAALRSLTNVVGGAAIFDLALPPTSFAEAAAGLAGAVWPRSDWGGDGW